MNQPKTPYVVIRRQYFNTLKPRQNGRHFADDIFKCIFLNENAWISRKISLKFVPMVQINNIPALVQIMAWRRPGDKPLSEPMMVSLLTHICFTRPQWVKANCIVLCVQYQSILPKILFWYTPIWIQYLVRQLKRHMLRSVCFHCEIKWVRKKSEMTW